MTAAEMAALLAEQHRARGRVVTEMVLSHGYCRADVAVITRHGTAGYELKAATDTIGRLRRQVFHYGRVFDTCTLVVTAKHLHADELLPPWWGLLLAEDGELRTLRRPAVNRAQCITGLLMMLWRDELVQVMTAAGVYVAKREPKWKLLRRAQTEVPFAALRAGVAAALASRPAGWLDTDPLTV